MRYGTLFLASLILLVGLALPISGADTKPTIEYKVKAAFLYNFIKFVEWPNDQKADVNIPITIGIIGEDNFGAAFDEIASRKIKDRSLVIKRFADFDTDEAKAGLPQCQLVFVSASQQQYTKDIITLLRKKPILIIGESKGFLEAGGAVNFVMQDGKVCFEINTDMTDEANLKVASQLLRLAKRVVKSEKTQTSKLDNMIFWNTGGA